ncbi:hypothetical protein H310_08908 [Aphanomyces invadans]|uniref:NAD(+) ADP-ribosyltransferase n=1 Tax=Aphanomyces invadans TaxID=157072 RepID=A0A024TW12_9STRA|nr:hypothetical protein H310_08908 [Aphanomyces invadans]ETV98179.1 hypothetical protein H310_08908 [Aphanomyces invadans]|eukprot:XP_008873054.1 hypothetical protein H310_08908 [Aphanomyces invadans]
MLSHVAITRQRTANDFFRLRLVQDSPVAWSIWSCWGPVGDVGECEKEGPWQSLEHAESAFCQRFQAKTKNKWADRHQFEVKPGAYGIVDLDNGRHRSAVAAAASLAESHRPQQGVRVFFDAWDGGVHLDMKCMPLGTLSARQIEKGMAVLDALRGCVDSGSVLKSMFQSLSAHFYQIIPHASPLVVLSTRKQLNTKHGMLSRLHGLVTGATIENAMRSHRMMTPSSLHCDLDTVTRMDSMHPVIIKYISNGGGDMAKVVGI